MFSLAFVGFTKEQLNAFRDATVPDLYGPGCKLLFVGINPGLWTAATQTHFCHPSNRFYPALRMAGLIDWEVDTAVGMSADQKQDLIRRGIGISNLVERATVRASELSTAELRSGAEDLAVRVARIAPKVVAVAGITAYRSAFGDLKAQTGQQPGSLSGAEVWVVPNPSGLNAHETMDSLAIWYKKVADAAGIE